MGYRSRVTAVIAIFSGDPRALQNCPSRKALAELYQLRWQVTEVNLKHIKTILKMEMTGKTPEMVRKEISVVEMLKLRHLIQ